jgi:D-galactose 1-dehydrogenase
VIRIAIVGLGKIARDQHVPALRSSADFELIAVASPHDELDGVASFKDIESMLTALPQIEAVALCTAPQVRYPLARFALEHGRHVLLEKPPGATLGEVHALNSVAEQRGVALLAAWHSRFARGIEPARAWLTGRSVVDAAVSWKEDVRVWHPGQRWIWKAGGLGVFDPGINALSILTRIIPAPWVIADAELQFPSNCATPIAAQLVLHGAAGAVARVELDFLQTGTQTWDIDIVTKGGRLTLTRGGSELAIDGRAVGLPPSTEYGNLYAHFAELIARCGIDMDAAPLRLVADAFLCGRRIQVAPYIE